MDKEKGSLKTFIGAGIPNDETLVKELGFKVSARRKKMLIHYFQIGAGGP